MAEDVKAEEILEQLRAGFARHITEALRELPAHQALQMADALCTVQIETLAGMRVLYKARPQIDGEAIAEEWRRGTPVGEICRKHGCSKRTAYNYNPTSSGRINTEVNARRAAASQGGTK